MKITKAQMHDFQRQWDDDCSCSKACGDSIHIRYGQAWYNFFVRGNVKLDADDIARMNRIHAERDPGKARAMIEHFILP